MTDILEEFIEEHKTKLTQDKAKLENDPPYMEMRNNSAEKLSETNKMLISMAKENIPPNSQQTGVHEYGLSLPLGEEYEHKKHKLKEELRQDYRRYLSQGISQAKKKKKYLTSGEVDPCTQGLSLPIGDRKSAKERLILERNKEYNQYLREKEEWKEKLRRLGKKRTEHETSKNKKSLPVPRAQPEFHAQIVSPRRDENSFKKDACTCTEAYQVLSSNKRQSIDQHLKPDNESGPGDSIAHVKPDEERNVSQRKPQRLDRKPPISIRRHWPCDGDHDPEISDEMDPRFRYESDYDKRPLRVFHAQRSEANDRTRAAASDVPYATGLILGGQDKELTQRRKEQYRQQLMEQMAEQQRNKKREKELMLPVAASGAVDPEKMPDRLKELGLTPRIPEERAPPERPRPAFQTPTPGPSSVHTISPLNENFHKGLSAALGEMLAPRIAPLPPPPPPPPPTLTDNYRTPYDDAYYFYGARNPLDPSLAYYGPALMGAPSAVSALAQAQAQAPVLDTAQRPTVQAVSKIGARVINDRPRGLGMFPEEKPKPSKEATLAYQQELQQQIREREERRRQEKEEKERYDAKLDAEMRNYNPWGKGGGGAPLRDKKGNLITDLNMMHKQNEDAYHNPDARAYEDKRAIVSVDLSLASPRFENSDESTNKIAGFTRAQPSPFARGNVFGEPPTPEQIRRQESYKSFLRFQIEEKRKREESEREKRRLEEEKEEKILAEQRAKIQREYEEEQDKRRRREEERLKNEELYRLAEERRKETEKKKKEEQQQDKLLQHNHEKEKHSKTEDQISRHTSPVITTLHTKLLPKDEREFVGESRMSYYTQDVPQPRVHSPPVPARRNQLRAYEEKKSVINELSEMRKQLRSEERRLQEQLLKVHSDEDDVPAKGRKKDKYNLDVFEMARLRMQAPVRRPSSKDVFDPINVQNIREFNELKYKDSESRVEVRGMYPEPPVDDDTLDIQQQALLREQQKKLTKMRKHTEAGLDFDDPGPSVHSRSREMARDEANEFMKNSLLESESAFIGTDGQTFPPLEEPDFTVNLTPPPVSARERRREKKKNNVPPRLTPPPPPPPAPSNVSGSSLNIDQLKARNEERLQRLNELQKKAIHIGDDMSLGPADDILEQLPPKAARSNSVDTVATEPWLRPGTSETLKRFMAEPSSQAKLSSEKNLPFNWQGLSTAHG